MWRMLSFAIVLLLADSTMVNFRVLARAMSSVARAFEANAVVPDVVGKAPEAAVTVRWVTIVSCYIRLTQYPYKVLLKLLKYLKPVLTFKYLLHYHLLPITLIWRPYWSLDNEGGSGFEPNFALGCDAV